MFYGDITFDSFFAEMFLEVLKRTQSGEVKWNAVIDGKDVVKKEFVSNHFLVKSLNNTNYYSRSHDLKFFGLTSQRPEWYHQGIYQVTPQAFEFILQRTQVPRSLTVSKKTGHIAKAEGTTSLADALADRVPIWKDFIEDWRKGKGLGSFGGQQELF